MREDESSRLPDIEWEGFYNIRPGLYSDSYPHANYFCTQGGLLQPTFDEINAVSEMFAAFNTEVPSSCTIGWDDRTVLLGISKAHDLTEENFRKIQLLLQSKSPLWRVVLDNRGEIKVVIYPTAIVASVEGNLASIAEKIRVDQSQYLEQTRGVVDRQFEWVSSQIMQNDLEIPSVISIFDRTDLDDNDYTIWVVDCAPPKSWVKNEVQNFEGELGSMEFLRLRDGSFVDYGDYLKNDEKHSDPICRIVGLAFSKTNFPFSITFVDPETNNEVVVDLSHFPVLNDTNLLK